MGPKTLKVEELVLDTNNPRVETSKSQHEEIQRLLDDQGDDLLSLAEDILENGLSPIERLLVMQDKDDPEKFAVLEGNRRLLALKIMVNPSLLGGLEVDSKLKKQFEEAASEFKNKPTVHAVDCYAVDTRDQARHWILLRHTGANDGAGVVDWTAVASARFRGEDPALQALEFVSKFGHLSPEEKAQIGRRDFPISTLDRLLNSKAVRERLGFDVKKQKLTTGLPPEEFIKALRRIVLDLGSKRVRVGRVMNTESQINYIEKDFSADDRPDLSKAGAHKPVEDIVEADFKKKPESAKPQRRRSSDPSDRMTLAPRSPRLSVSNAKIAEIYKECQRLRTGEFPHACAVLLRVFLELSVDHCLTAAKVSLQFKDPNSGRMVHKKLLQKVKEAIAHLIKSGASERDFKALLHGLNDDKSPLNIDLLHLYVHNRFYTPGERELRRGWNHAQPLFDTNWA